MRLDIHLYGSLAASHSRPVPHIHHLVRSLSIQLWNLAKVDLHTPRLVKRVEHGDHSSIRARTGPVLRRDGVVECPVWVSTPLVRSSRLAKDWVLVEG